MVALKSLYLGSYNIILCLGWAHILLLAVTTLLQSGAQAVYPAIEKPLQIWQTAALFEIFNSLTGIVRSPISATLPQISSRLFITWGILYSFPETQESLFVVSLILSWALVEIVRYGFFALKETMGAPPRTMLWLRYSLFFFLYPTGIVSEMGLIWVALPYIQKSDLYSIHMPNAFNFAFDYYSACVIALASYLPGGPYMYTYMINQRKKALGKKEKTQ